MHSVFQTAPKWRYLVRHCLYSYRWICIPVDSCKSTQRHGKHRRGGLFLHCLVPRCGESGFRCLHMGTFSRTRCRWKQAWAVGRICEKDQLCHVQVKDWWSIPSGSRTWVGALCMQFYPSVKTVWKDLKAHDNICISQSKTWYIMYVSLGISSTRSCGFHLLPIHDPTLVWIVLDVRWADCVQ